jgi:hypothetical protein
MIGNWPHYYINASLARGVDFRSSFKKWKDVAMKIMQKKIPGA